MRKSLYVLGASLLSLPAQAQQGGCAPADTAIRYLADSHQEAPVAVFDSPKGRVFIFATKDGSTWTMVVEVGDQFCVVMDGHRFRAIAWRDPGKQS